MPSHFVPILLLLCMPAMLLPQVTKPVLAEPPDSVADSGAPLPAGAVMRLGTARFSDVGRPFALSFSRNGKVLVAGSWDGAISVWDVEKRKLLTEWDSQCGAVLALVLAPDASTLASAGRPEGIRIWNSDGGLVKTLVGHKENINVLAYSPCGKRLVSAGRKSVRLWDLTSGKPIYSLERFGAVPSFSVDGSTLAIAYRDGGQTPEGKAFVLTVDVQSGQQTKHLLLPPGSVPLLHLAGDKFALSSSGKRLVHVAAPGPLQRLDLLG